MMLCMVFTFTSCRRDLLETIPIDRVSSEIFWKTDADATNASTAIYTFMDAATVSNVPLLFIDGFSDIGHYNATGATESPIEQGIADAQNAKFAEQYTTCYKGIRAANNFLENVGKITVTNAALVNARKGEVTTLRAYFYLKLVSLYGAVPLVTKTLTIEEGANVTRTEVSKIYDFIAAELDAAALLLPNTPTDKGRLSKGAALSIKARAMLYAGRYQEAAAAAQAVIDMNVYSLYPKYGQLFSYPAENNSEVIWDKQFLKDVYPNNVFSQLAPASLAAAVAQVVPTKQLGDEFEMTNGKMIADPGSGFDAFNPYNNRDPRMRFTMFLPGDMLFNNKPFNPVPGSGTSDAIGGGNQFATSTGYNVKKYINSVDLASPNNCGINLIFIRYAEILLTYAEAKVELNQLDESVYLAINKVRTRSDVNMPPIPAGKTQAELRVAVRHERTVELAFEGLHLFDIRRWKTAELVMPGPIKGITYVKDGKLITVTNNSAVRTFAQKDYLWPIPRQEVIINPKLTQNPGW